MIYAVHRHSRKTDTTTQMEAFPSVERASVALQIRARKRECILYPVGEDRPPYDRQPVKFPDADMSGYMLVWRRKAGDRPTPGEAPEEVWSLTERGGVVKQPYDGEGKELTLPQLTPDERRAKALKYVGGLPLLTDRFLDGVDPTVRRALRDLVQDNEVELAVLRILQAQWVSDRGAGT